MALLSLSGSDSYFIYLIYRYSIGRFNVGSVPGIINKEALS